MTSLSTTCPELGRLRAWLDGDPVAGRAPELVPHLAACVACRESVRELRRDAATAGAAIGRLAPGELPAPRAIELARLRFAARRSGRPGDRREWDEASPAPLGAPEDQAAHPWPARPQPAQERDPMIVARTRRWRVALGGLAAAFALTFLVGSPDGQAVAAQFLAQFRSQRLAPISIDSTGGRESFGQLERLGTVQGGRPSASAVEVATVDQARGRVGFPVKRPDPETLPAGLSMPPKIMVTQESETRFTFDRVRAREYFRSIGRDDLTLPDKYHGVSLVAVMPAAVLMTYERAGAPPPVAGPRDKIGRAAELSGSMGLVIGQSGELKVGVEGGASLEEIRDYLLKVPGLPPEVARQLRDIQDWRTALPFPIPADRVSWQETDLAGGRGLLFADNTGAGGAAVWLHDGRVHGVAGPLKAAELRRVADGLR